MFSINKSRLELFLKNFWCFRSISKFIFESSEFLVNDGVVWCSEEGGGVVVVVSVVVDVAAFVVLVVGPC